ncbi:MAG: hypothetical protein HOP30_22115 [Cyclobacteriaceae bacterium]|nr:hypothetical protein [Cyclobacteriaceae bacterium]
MNIELSKYRNCLFEIKKRTEVIKQFVSKGKTTGYLITDVELICLQFRKIIELIALGSLVANKDVYSKERERFKEDWNARLIFQDLERMNPRFYPEPSMQIEKLNTTGEKYFHFEPIKTGYMTRTDALKIYEKCGGVLHADNPFKGERDIKEIRNKFSTWATRLITLMNHHSIILNNGHMVVGLMQGRDDGLPHVTLFGEVSGAEKQKLKDMMRN